MRTVYTFIASYGMPRKNRGVDQLPCTRSLPPNETVQRTGASRFAQRQIDRHRRLAPIAIRRLCRQT